jgi:hypothetical protein
MHGVATHARVPVCPGHQRERAVRRKLRILILLILVILITLLIAICILSCRIRSTPSVIRAVVHILQIERAAQQHRRSPAHIRLGGRRRQRRAARARRRDGGAQRGGVLSARHDARAQLRLLGVC